MEKDKLSVVMKAPGIHLLNKAHNGRCSFTSAVYFFKRGCGYKIKVASLQRQTWRGVNLSPLPSGGHHKQGKVPALLADAVNNATPALLFVTVTAFDTRSCDNTLPPTSRRAF